MKKMKQKIKLQGNPWTLSLSMLSIVGCFFLMFHLNMFNRVIGFKGQFFYFLYVALCIGFGLFFVGVYYEGKKGGLRFLKNWALTYAVAYLIGYLKSLGQ